MTNIIEYAKYYRNKSFEVIPFNEVDALILSCLAYLNFDKVITTLPITISDLAIEYFSKVKPETQKVQGRLYLDCYNLFKAIKSTIRFKDLVISDYKKVVDIDTQFGAITFRNKDSVFISFEGTNTYISGWKEDGHLSHHFPIPSQVLAKTYINDNVKPKDKTIYIGGHSKGANLAVAGAFSANIDIKRRITAIYDFDGPGLREKEFITPEYVLISPKIKKYVPNHSIVGMLMYYPENFITIKSTSKSIFQHNPFTWQCFGSFFVEDTLSRKSIRFSKKIKEFVNEYDEESMKNFVETIFKVFKDADIKNTDTITISKIARCLKYTKEIKTDKETKEKVYKLLSMLIELHK